jgi:arginine:ornithine antiporter / lysine permease
VPASTPGTPAAREDVGRATLLGFATVLSIFASVTIVSYGILPHEELAELRQPSMAGVLEAAVGQWGEVFVSIGLIISVLGAYLAWTLMAAEVLFVAAADHDMPRFLGRKTGDEVPGPALLLTTVLVQVMLVETAFSENAFNFALNLTSALTLIPFLLAAGYAAKLALGRDGERPGGPPREIVIGLLATLYTAFLLYAAGPKYLLVSFVVYAPATVLFVMARREQGRRPFGPGELLILAVSVAGAVGGVVALSQGWISL